MGDSPNVTLKSKGKKQCGDEKISSALDPMQSMLAAINESTKMELRRRYPAETNSHRNMLSRCGKRGPTIHPSFREFASFLRQVGPIPALGATLDRIDNDDPEYAPGKVRWADKRTQNGNKGDTLLFHYSRTGDTYTTSRLAKLQTVTQNTIRTRLHRGWTDDEIIEGQRALVAPPPFQVPAAKPKPLYTTTKIRRQDETAAEIMFERNARSCQFNREQDGEEYFLATPKELGEVLPEVCGPEWVRECWPIFMKRKLPRWWREYKPHMVRRSLECSAMSELI